MLKPLAIIMALSAVLLVVLIISVLLTTVSYPVILAIIILAMALLALMGWVQAKKAVCARIMVPP